MLTDSQKAKNFLVVDDVNSSRVVVIRALKKLGIQQIYSATNGLEALSVFEDPDIDIDCVVTDFEMPVMHGLQLLKAIRLGHNGIRRNLPVAMVTGHSEPNLVLLAMAFDVNAFLIKPFHLEIMEERVRTILTSRSKILPSDFYLGIEVEDTISALLKRRTLSLDNILEESQYELESDHLRSAVGGEEMECELEDVPVNSILVRDLSTTQGQRILLRNTLLSEEVLLKLDDLTAFGFTFPPLCIQTTDSSGDPLQRPEIIISDEPAPPETPEEETPASESRNITRMARAERYESSRKKRR